MSGKKFSDGMSISFSLGGLGALLSPKVGLFCVFGGTKFGRSQRLEIWDTLTCCI